MSESWSKRIAALESVRAQEQESRHKLFKAHEELRGKQSEIDSLKRQLDGMYK